MNKVSIVLVCYNEILNIEDCLKSILNQSYKKFELIIIDNDSNDGTKDLLKTYSKKDNRIRYFINRIKGIAVSRNIGLEKWKEIIFIIFFLYFEEFLQIKYLSKKTKDDKGNTL